ncbi:MAG: flavin reductase [Rhodovarius sp.]|nr:flavin reductase [Rhodovarius sp.]MCX7933027.1 flavin reductase [Rhodovarius sp.]MDW8314257.1 flavin reductase [Rhodovarius sp.]
MDRQMFRNGMARLAAAVNLVTTDGPAGRAGFTASAVCSVTDDPPTLLVCMNRSHSHAEAFLRNGVLCVNTLAAGQEELSQTFAGLRGLEGAARFSVGRWQVLATGAPVLSDAAVAFDCEVAQRIEQGTHSVLFGRVRAVLLGPEGGGLVYFRRRYHALT